MRREKKSNPYSDRGLEEFARLHTELAAKREYVAKKKGVAADAVRFAYHKQRWVPVVMKNKNSDDGRRPAGDSTVAPPETKAIQDGMAPVETKAVPVQEAKFEEMEIEGIHGAVGVIIVVLYMIYGGSLCAILWACACCWWCVLVILSKGKNGFAYDNISRIRMTIDVESKRKKVKMGGGDVSENMRLDTCHEL